MSHHLFRDPLRPIASQFNKIKVKWNCGVYAILHEDGRSLIKIGSTTRLWRRREYYLQQENLDYCRFVVMVDFDNISIEVNDEFQSLYTEYVNEISTCTHLHPFQRFFFRQMFERGGDRLGGKRIVWLQLMESGFQSMYNLPSPQEFLMFDEKVVDSLYKLVHKESHAILGDLGRIMEMTRKDDPPGKQMFLHALCSWKPGFNGISSKISAAAIPPSGRIPLTLPPSHMPKHEKKCMPKINTPQNTRPMDVIVHATSSVLYSRPNMGLFSLTRTNSSLITIP